MLYFIYPLICWLIFKMHPLWTRIYKYLCGMLMGILWWLFRFIQPDHRVDLCQRFQESPSWHLLVLFPHTLVNIYNRLFFWCWLFAWRQMKYQFWFVSVSLPIKNIAHLDNTYWASESCPWELMIQIVDQYTDLLTSDTYSKGYLYTREVA